MRGEPTLLKTVQCTVLVGELSLAHYTRQALTVTAVALTAVRKVSANFICRQMMCRRATRAVVRREAASKASGFQPSRAMTGIPPFGGNAATFPHPSARNRGLRESARKFC